MAKQKKLTLGLWPHIISFVTSFLVGIDIFFFFFLYVYASLGLLPAIFIGLNGLVLNAYLYYIDGPTSLIDLWRAKHDHEWKYLFDFIAFLGGLLIFVFTFYVYAQWVVIYPFMAMWTTPFLVLIMAFSDGIGTYTMNKSGFIHMLGDHAKKTLLLTLADAWVRFKNHFIQKVYKGEASWHFGTIWRAIKLFVFPMFLALVVSFSFTRTYLLGSLAIVQGTIFSWVLVPLLWVSAGAFFIGELYFNSEQNLALMQHYEEDEQILTKNIATFALILVIAANAIANGFIAMESSLLTITAWGILRFGSSALQYFAVFSSKCMQYTGWNKIHAGQASRIMNVSFMIIALLMIIYLLQIILANITLPFALPMPIFMLPFAFIFLVQGSGFIYGVFVPPRIHKEDLSVKSCALLVSDTKQDSSRAHESNSLKKNDSGRNKKNVVSEELSI